MVFSTSFGSFVVTREALSARRDLITFSNSGLIFLLPTALAVGWRVADYSWALAPYTFLTWYFPLVLEPLGPLS